MKYICRHCGQVVERISTKAWIKSWCSENQKNVHLMRIDDHQEKMEEIEVSEYTWRGEDGKPLVKPGILHIDRLKKMSSIYASTIASLNKATEEQIRSLMGIPKNLIDEQEVEGGACKNAKEDH